MDIKVFKKLFFHRRVLIFKYKKTPILNTPRLVF